MTDPLANSAGASQSSPTGAELKLLRPLWDAGALSAREVHDASVQQTGWSYSTTRTTLDRMADKGLVATKPVHGVKVYTPAHAKVETLASLIRAFSRLVLDLDAPLPAAAFAGSRLINAAEAAALEALLSDNESEDAADRATQNSPESRLASDEGGERS